MFNIDHYKNCIAIYLSKESLINVHRIEIIFYAKLLILNPRLANKPAILVKTPDSSSTKTESVCFIFFT